MERILVIKLGALGDIIQAEGAMHDIRLHHPQAEITVLTTPPYKRLLERSPWVDRVLVDRRESRFRLDRMYLLRRQLRRLRFSMVYDLQQVSRTAFYYRWMLRDVPWLGGVKGCNYYRCRPQDSCAADHFAESFEQAGLVADHCRLTDVSWLADEVAVILERFNLTDGYLVLIPGGSKRHPQKRWPYYQRLAQQLVDDGWQVVTVPGPDEMDLCADMAGTMVTDDGVYLDYFQLAGVLKKAAYVVGNDTGPTHIAAQMGIAGLALFSGHTPPQQTGIQHSRFSWLLKADLRELALSEVLQAVPERMP